MSKHQPFIHNCQCSDCVEERKQDRNDAWVKKLSPEDRRRWYLLQRQECPKCQGKKPEGEACHDCGFRYADQEKP